MPPRLKGDWLRGVLRCGIYKKPPKHKKMVPEAGLEKIGPNVPTKPP
jgi:hypothetical protein